MFAVLNTPTWYRRRCAASSVLWPATSPRVQLQRPLNHRRPRRHRAFESDGLDDLLPTGRHGECQRDYSAFVRAAHLKADRRVSIPEVPEVLLDAKAGSALFTDGQRGAVRESGRCGGVERQRGRSAGHGHRADARWRAFGDPDRKHGRVATHTNRHGLDLGVSEAPRRVRLCDHVTQRCRVSPDGSLVSGRHCQRHEVEFGHDSLAIELDGPLRGFRAGGDRHGRQQAPRDGLDALRS